VAHVVVDVRQRAHVGIGHRLPVGFGAPAGRIVLRDGTRPRKGAAGRGRRARRGMGTKGQKIPGEEGTSDHVARHWALTTYNGHITNVSMGEPPGLPRWYMARATLVGFVGLMERVYNTHAIYDALGVAKFEADIVERSMPKHLFS